MSHALVILNPTAGDKQLKNNSETIKQKLAQKYDTVDLYHTKFRGDGAEYVKENARNADIVIGAGGDGTIDELVNALCALDQRPAFAIIPGGTCNDFSRAIGMSQKPLEALDQILEGETKNVDIGWTNHQYFVNFWGVGLITQVSENLDENKTLGRLSYYLSSLQTFSETDSFHLKLQSKERSFDGQAVMLLVGNGPFTGGLKAFFPNCNLQDGLLDVLIIKQSSLASFWSIFRSSVAQEDRFDADDIVHFQTEALTVACRPEQKIDCDGERNASTPSQIKILPRFLTVHVGDF